jgi:hypothetical protein
VVGNFPAIIIDKAGNFLTRFPNTKLMQFSGENIELLSNLVFEPLNQAAA